VVVDVPVVAVVSGCSAVVATGVVVPCSSESSPVAVVEPAPYSVTVPCVVPLELVVAPVLLAPATLAL
jgi:hypothetical protein